MEAVPLLDDKNFIAVRTNEKSKLIDKETVEVGKVNCFNILIRQKLKVEFGIY